MTTREERRWDAAKAAMQGLLLNSDWIERQPTMLATRAFSYADALLVEFEKSAPQAEQADELRCTKAERDDALAKLAELNEVVLTIGELKWSHTWHPESITKAEKWNTVFRKLLAEREAAKKAEKDNEKAERAYAEFEAAKKAKEASDGC